MDFILNKGVETKFVNNMETKFVNNFLIRQKQERILFELQKKRSRAIDRFSHDVKVLLNSNIILLSGEHLRIDDVVKALQDYNISLRAMVCIISGNETLDNKIISLQEAIKFFFNDYLQMVITDGEHFALIKEETSGSYSQKYVLINQVKSN